MYHRMTQFKASSFEASNCAKQDGHNNKIQDAHFHVRIESLRSKSTTKRFSVGDFAMSVGDLLGPKTWT